MQMIHSAKHWLKTSESPSARLLMGVVNQVRFFEIPSWKCIHKPLYWAHTSLINLASNLTRIFYWTPLFKSRLSHCGSRFYLYSGMPLVLGKLDIRLADNVRLSGVSTLCGRSSAQAIPQLIVGSNVDIGWQNTLAVGSLIKIGDNVRLAGKVFLAGFPGHPLDAQKRALGLPEEDHQVGDIVLEDDVWLATGVTVMAGVRIGKGTVVAAGSVVTQNLPSGVIAAGVPAKVIRNI